MIDGDAFLQLAKRIALSIALIALLFAAAICCSGCASKRAVESGGMAESSGPIVLDIERFNQSNPDTFVIAWDGPGIPEVSRDGVTWEERRPSGNVGTEGRWYFQSAFTAPMLFMRVRAR